MTAESTPHIKKGKKENASRQPSPHTIETEDMKKHGSDNMIAKEQTVPIDDEREQVPDKPQFSTTLRPVQVETENAGKNSDEPPVASPSMSITRLKGSLQSIPPIAQSETDTQFPTPPAPQGPHGSSSPRRYSPPPSSRALYGYDATREQQHPDYAPPRDNGQRDHTDFVDSGMNSASYMPGPPPSRTRNYNYDPEAATPYSYTPPPQHHTYTLPAHTNNSNHPHPDNGGANGFHPHHQPQFGGGYGHGYPQPDGRNMHMHPSANGYYSEQASYSQGNSAYPSNSMSSPNMGGPFSNGGGGGDIHIMYTDDAATKLSDRLRRRCFNCGSTDTSTWRRSNLNAGKVLCNKCGLFERTHARSRPEQFPHRRGPLITASLGRSPPSPHGQARGHHQPSAGGGRRMRSPDGHNVQSIPPNTYTHPSAQAHHHHSPALYPTVPGSGYGAGVPMPNYSNGQHVSPYTYSPNPYNQQGPRPPQNPYIDPNLSPSDNSMYRGQPGHDDGHPSQYPERIASRNPEHSPRDLMMNPESAVRNDVSGLRGPPAVPTIQSAMIEDARETSDAREYNEGRGQAEKMKQEDSSDAAAQPSAPSSEMEEKKPVISRAATPVSTGNVSPGK